MDGIIWLLSGFDKEQWLDKNLEYLYPVLEQRLNDLVFVVSNKTNLFGRVKQHDRIDFCQISYNRGTTSRMDYGTVDLFHQASYYAKLKDSDKIKYVVSLHWDVLLHTPQIIIDICKTLEEENKDLACYFRKINADLGEEVCPHGWLLIMKKELVMEYNILATLPVYEQPDWGIERALLFWLKRFYKMEVYPLHSKILNLGLIDYYTSELTHTHFHDWKKVEAFL